MWGFGYGSLMWDGWQTEFGCTRTEQATLVGFRRDFNKKSVQRWGSRDIPGPTLGLTPDDAQRCVGMAFEFPDSERNRLLAALGDREGPSFRLKDMEIELQSGSRVVAIVPVNDRSANTYIGDQPLEERARLAKDARGTAGACRDYVKNIRTMLLKLSINDSSVEQFWKKVSEE